MSDFCDQYQIQWFPKNQTWLRSHFKHKAVPKLTAYFFWSHYMIKGNWCWAPWKWSRAAVDDIWKVVRLQNLHPTSRVKVRSQKQYCCLSTSSLMCGHVAVELAADCAVTSSNLWIDLAWKDLPFVSHLHILDNSEQVTGVKPRIRTRYCIMPSTRITAFYLKLPHSQTNQTCK